MYLAAFLLDFSVATAITVMPFYAFQHLQGGPALSGALGAAQMAVYAAGCLLSAAFLAHTANDLRYALAGVAIFAAPFALVPFIGTPVLCGFMASVPFIGLALAWPAMQTWLGTEPDLERRARHLTGFNTATAFGFTFSPLLAGPMFDLDYRLPFLGLLVLALAVAALLKSLPRDCGQARPDLEGGEVSGSDPVAGSRGLLYALWGATFTASALFASVRSVYPSRVDALVGDGALTVIGDWLPRWLAAAGAATVFSWMAFALSLATVACFAVMGRTSRWHGRFSVIVAGQAIAAAACVLLGGAQSLAVMLVCFILVGANFGLCFFASLFYSLAEARRSHQRAAVNEGVLGAGGFAGGIGAGYAAGHWGLAPTFQWMPLFVALAVAVQLVLLRAFRT